MKKFILLGLFTAVLSCFAEYVGGGGVSSVQLAAETSAREAADATKVDNNSGTATNLTQVGTFKTVSPVASTNYISSVYTNGQMVITEVYNGTTNTYYDFTN